MKNNNKMAATLTARIINGRRVLCSHPARTGLNGEMLRPCGGELGEIAATVREHTLVGRDENGNRIEKIETFAGNVFYLSRDFGFDKDGVCWITKRAHHRSWGRESLAKRVDGRLRFVAGEREKDRRWTQWGRDGDFSLPIEIRCPKCEGLNSITDSLIEAAPIQIGGI